MSAFDAEIAGPQAVATEARRLRDLWENFASARVQVVADCTCCAPGTAMFLDGREFQQDILDFMYANYTAARMPEARQLLVERAGYKLGEAGDLSAFLAAVAELEDGPAAPAMPWASVVADLARTIESLTSFAPS